MLALFALLPVLVVTYLASKRIASSLELMKSPGVTTTLDDALAVSKTSLNTLEDALHAICSEAAAETSLAAAVADGESGRIIRSLDSILRRHGLNYGALYTKEKEQAWSLAATATRPSDSGAAPDTPEGPQRESVDSPNRPGGSPDTSARSSIAPGGSRDERGASPDVPGGSRAASAASPPKTENIPPPDLPRPLAPGMHYDAAGWLLDTVEMERPEEGGDALLVLGYHMGTDFFDRVQGISRGIGFYRRLDVLKRLYVGGIWIWAAGVLLVTATATLITSRFAARGLSRPLVELADGMRSVARGDENVVVKPRGSRETKFLAGAFNLMVKELAAYKKDLARAERIAAWQDIARVAAHEIRNPLTPIRFAIHRMKDRLKAVPESERDSFRESMDSILGEVDTLKALASDFSQYAKLPEPSPSAEDLNKLVAETAGLFGGEKDAEVRLKLDTDLPAARVDPGQIRMVMNNLLKNAVESIPRGGTITVSTRAEKGTDGKFALIEVTDTGVGMDAATLARATDAYFSTKAKGSGLGLAVVQKIVTQHGGRLDLASSPGKGTRISLRLPLAG
jgi:signal transduction histidine kinase